MCASHGMRPGIVKSRLKAGYSLERALNPKRVDVAERGGRVSGQAVVIRGTRYKSLTHVAEVFGVTFSTLHRNLKRNHPDVDRKDPKTFGAVVRREIDAMLARREKRLTSR